MAIAPGQRVSAQDINGLSFFPVGTILMYGGSQWAKVKEVLVDWEICTELIGRFVRGAAAESAGATGGNVAGVQRIYLTENNIPAHTHTITDRGHSHRITDPGHRHNIITEHLESGMGSITEGGGGEFRTYSTEAAATGVTVNSATSNVSVERTGSGEPISININPAYYELIYIKKVR